MNRKQRRADKNAGTGRAPSHDVVALFSAAVAHHQAGRTAEAIPLYQAALTIRPGAPEALYNLGLALGAQGRLMEASACYKTLIALAPDNADAHNNLGNIQRDLGDTAGAAASLTRAIALRPDYAEAYNNLGNVLRDQNLLDDAEIRFRQAIGINPGFVQAFNNLGNVLKDRSRLDEAVAACRQAIALAPSYAEAHNTLGNALRAQELPDEATVCYRTATALKNDLPEAHKNLGDMLELAGQSEQAAAHYRRALDLRPSFSEAYGGLGQTLLALDQIETAEAACRQAIQYDPALAAPHNTLGIILQRQGLLDDAAAAFQTALDLNPDLAETYANIGSLLLEQRRLPEAAAQCRTALYLKPNFAEAHFQLATLLLAQGQFEAGWQEYEWRWKTAFMRHNGPPLPQPQWRGEAAPGQTLLIRAEQGFGDALQFCRYAPLAAERGLHVILEVPKPLARLMQSLPGVASVVVSGDALPGFDLYCPMLSLPLAMGTTLDTIPAGGPYLRATEADIAAWDARMARGPSKALRVGLVWAGGTGTKTDSRRSLPASLLAPLCQMPGVQFFSLQKQAGSDAGVLPLTDLMADVDDFADSAALIANLDLVIAVDTSVAHLAGALGKPVWLLDRFDAEWRWLTGRRDSPWYPTMRLYRQPARGDWDTVLAEVIQDLRTLAENDKVPGPARSLDIQPA
jgi:tetratricopeptide (TPR) repeat protein